MTSLISSWLLLAAGLLFCLGILLGTTLTIQMMRPKLDHLAKERKHLDEEWQALREAGHPERPCPRCRYLVTRQDWYDTPAAQDPEDAA